MNFFSIQLQLLVLYGTSKIFSIFKFIFLFQMPQNKTYLRRKVLMKYL